MTGFPEWFIGGPWHGRDRRTQSPNTQGRIEVLFPRVDAPVSWCDLGSEVPTYSTFVVVYVAKTFVMFDNMFTCYVLETDLPDLTESMPLIRDLMLAPHRDESEAPFDALDYGRRYALNFMETYDRRLRDSRYISDSRGIAELQATITRLERNIEALRMTNQTQAQIIHETREQLNRNKTSRTLLTEYPEGAVRIEWVTGDDEGAILITEALTYYDEGSHDIPGAWCATVPGDVHGSPRDLFGYGPDKVTALVALAMDTLGYFASIRHVEEPVIPPILHSNPVDNGDE